MTIERVLDAGIVVCAGSGGVGKTTISAAIALEGARRGKRTIVLTIDPAKRLANSLGLKALGNDPQRIDPEKFEDAGLEPVDLDAMMLDTKTTFDRLIHRYASDEARARRILQNRFYQAISGALGGTHEYMAMEKLYELHSDGEYDFIVIDTPPTRNALDFLEAPRKVTSFLEGRLLKWFLLPAIGGGKGIFRAFNFAAVQFLRVVKRIIGAQVLEDTAEFFANFEGMYEGFKERAQAVFELLRRPESNFVVVTSPGETAVDEALFFASTLNDYELHFGGLVANRVHPTFDVSLEACDDEVIERLLVLAADFHRVAVREEQVLKSLESEGGDYDWARVPFLTRDVVDLGALDEITSHLFGDG
jgi:anion-transporting  ArsA/GET3 family ATPase